MNQSFIAIVDSVQTIIEKYYRISIPLKASQFLLQTAPLDYNKRAGLIITYHHDETHLGLYFHEDIIANVQRNLYLTGLDHNAIDWFWVIIEEISHFVLYVYRHQQKMNTSHLELEWQAEIDKIVVLGIIATTKWGRSHIKTLVHKSFVESHIIADNEDTYLIANQYAGIFWYQLIKIGLGDRFEINQKKFTVFMQKNYEKTLWEKFPFSTSIQHLSTRTKVA